MAKKIGDKSCQSNSDKRASDFSFFLSYLITTVTKKKGLLVFLPKIWGDGPLSPPVLTALCTIQEFVRESLVTSKQCEHML